MFMSKVERGLLYDGFKAVCDSSIAWLDLLLVEGLFKRESNETCREGNAQSSGPWDM